MLFELKMGAKGAIVQRVSPLKQPSSNGTNYPVIFMKCTSMAALFMFVTNPAAAIPALVAGAALITGALGQTARLSPVLPNGKRAKSGAQVTKRFVRSLSPFNMK